MPGVLLDWSREQLCVICNRPMRPRGTTKNDMPGTVSHASHGECCACQAQRKRDEERTAEEERKKRYPTARELLEQGSPCVMGVIKPKRTKKVTWGRNVIQPWEIERRAWA